MENGQLGMHANFTCYNDNLTSPLHGSNLINKCFNSHSDEIGRLSHLHEQYEIWTLFETRAFAAPDERRLSAAELLYIYFLDRERSEVSNLYSEIGPNMELYVKDKWTPTLQTFQCMGMDQR